MHMQQKTKVHMKQASVRILHNLEIALQSLIHIAYIKLDMVIVFTTNEGLTWFLLLMGVEITKNKSYSFFTN